MKDTNSYYLLSHKEQPWYKERSEINSIALGQEIKPASTAYWFAYLENLNYGDFTKLNTNEVENMSYMFLRSGVNKESFELKGLNNWNTSNVKYMDYMFYQTADIVNWMIDLSNWIVTNVISHNHFNDLEKITEPKWNN